MECEGALSPQALSPGPSSPPPRASPNFHLSSPRLFTFAAPGPISCVRTGTFERPLFVITRQQALPASTPRQAVVAGDSDPDADSKSPRAYLPRDGTSTNQPTALITPRYGGTIRVRSAARHGRSRRFLTTKLAIFTPWAVLTAQGPAPSVAADGRVASLAPG